jgi:hypothetical protein
MRLTHLVAVFQRLGHSSTLVTAEFMARLKNAMTRRSVRRLANCFSEALSLRPPWRDTSEVFGLGDPDPWLCHTSATTLSTARRACDGTPGVGERSRLSAFSVGLSE